MTPIPAKSLEKHTAVVGKSGSGKTYASKGMVETLLQNGARVCVLDPTGVWWGLRSSADGKGEGFPVFVFGGEHGDAPLEKGHGKAIAEMIGTSNTSAVLDTRLLSVSDRTAFFADFAETLLAKNKGALHVVLDEAHIFAPQGRTDPQASRMLNAANNLVSLGRSSGLRITMITQRPAKLHKDSLTQANTMVAMQMIAPQDRKAVADWIGESAEDPAQAKEIIASLPKLRTGEGWIYAPDVDVLERVTFPPITTYDSSAAPDGDRDHVVLAKIDLADIQGRLASVEKEAVESDPKVLRARIAELEKAKGVDRSQIAAARSEGYRQGVEVGKAEKLLKVSTAAVEAYGLLGRAHEVLRQVIADRDAPKTAMEKLVHEGKPGIFVDVKLEPSEAALKSTEPFMFNSDQNARKVIPPAPDYPDELRISIDGFTISKSQQKILDAIAKFEAVGVKEIGKNQAAAFAGASPTSSTYTGNLRALKDAHLVHYPAAGMVALTATGRANANHPDKPMNDADVLAAWKRLLNPAQSMIVDQLVTDYPESITRVALAREVDASPTSSTFTGNLSALKALGLIEYPLLGCVAATALLVPFRARRAA